MATANQQAVMPPSFRWVAPFAIFMILLAVTPFLRLPPAADLGLRALLPGAAYLVLSRNLIEWRLRFPLLSVVLGVAVFILWVAPDLLAPGWRNHWLFQNALTGRLETTIPGAAYSEPSLMALRILRAAIVVPLVEELFWRGWLMRWLIQHDFESVALGTFARGAFWISALLFAAVHGPYWDVGLLSGAVYNGWMVRTRSLADMVLVHAVTNACLAAFVVATGRWEYWL